MKPTKPFFEMTFDEAIEYAKKESRPCYIINTGKNGSGMSENAMLMFKRCKE